MKKALGILATVLLVAALSGCFSKESKLECTQKASGVDITFNVGFKGNTVNKLDFSYDMDLSSYSDSYMSAIESQDFCSLVKKSMTGIENAFTDCKQNVADKKLTVSANLDVDKVSKSFLDKKGSPKATKKALEAEGFKCSFK